MSDQFPTPPKKQTSALSAVLDRLFDKVQAQALARIAADLAPDAVHRSQIDLPVDDLFVWPTMTCGLRLPHGYLSGSLRLQARLFGDTAAAGNIVYLWRAWHARLGASGYAAASPDATRTDTITVTATTAKIVRDTAIWVPPLNLQAGDIIRIVLSPAVSTYAGGVWVAGWSAYFEHTGGVYSMTGIAA